MSEEVKREVQTWDPVEWLDRIINGEQTYTLQEVPENSGHYKLVPDNVEVIQKGTPLSQSRLNRMTDGISFSHNVIGAIAAEALRQAGLAHKNRQVDFENVSYRAKPLLPERLGDIFLLLIRSSWYLFRPVQNIHKPIRHTMTLLCV